MNRDLLKGKGNQLCFICHKDDGFNRKKTHAPLSAKGCLACHDAHASDHEQYLFDTKNNLCAKCHDFEKSTF